MNTVTAPASAPEVKTTSARQDKAKGNAGEFADMFSGALKNKQASTKTEIGATKEPDTKPQASDKGQKPAKTEPVKDDAKTTEAKDAAGAADNKNTDIDEEAAAAAAAQASAKPAADNTPAEETAAADEAAVIMPVQAARVQKVYVKAEEAPATETAVKADATAQQTAQTQAAHGGQAAPAADTNADGASGVTVQSGEAKAASDAGKAQQESQRATAQDSPKPQTNTPSSEVTAPVKAEAQQSTGGEADTSSAGETVETTRQTAGEAAQEPETTQPPTKFDEMLAKASQELGKGKTTDGEASTVAAKDQGGDDTAIKTQETRQSDARATVQNTAKTPETEQRPLKEMPKTDELTLGLVQPKAEEISQTEPVKPMQQAPAANPVKIPEQSEQIRTEVIQSMENGKMEFNMQLRPQELGKVDVKMVLESGKLAVEIVAANSKSTELLSRQVESLVASLKANNIDVSSVNVVTASQSASGSMDGAYNLNNFQDQSSDGRQNGRTQGGQNGADSAEDDRQQEQEAKQGPQHILNYSV